jgi:hypothetical protein
LTGNLRHIGRGLQAANCQPIIINKRLNEADLIDKQQWLSEEQA